MDVAIHFQKHQPEPFGHFMFGFTFLPSRLFDKLTFWRLAISPSTGYTAVHGDVLRYLMIMYEIIYLWKLHKKATHIAV
jgi:hypothetical protein